MRQTRYDPQPQYFVSGYATSASFSLNARVFVFPHADGCRGASYRERGAHH